MTTIPNTTQHRIGRIDHGKRTVTKGVIVHVMAGTLEGTLQWWAQTTHEADGAHICIGLNRAVQTADLDAVCWHAPGDNNRIIGKQNGNHEFVGIEHEGLGSDTRRTWLNRRKQRILSANRCAWILYHYHLGVPRWNVNVGHHSDFPLGAHACPGAGFPDDVYISAARRAYRNLVKSDGKRWTRFPMPRRFSK